MPPAEDLPKEWREKAKTLRRFRAEGAASAFEECADDLDHALWVWREEPLTLAEAAEESGYSIDHLGRWVREGRIPNMGRPGAPRIARSDLPCKPTRRRPSLANSRTGCEDSNAQIVQSIIDRS